MKLGRDVELLDGLPMLYIKSLSAIACSDLHLGYEGVMGGKGAFIPKANLKSIKEKISAALKATGAESVIVVGDIKNEFSEVHVEEFNELREFVTYLYELGAKRVVLIKGNHDNFIDRLKPALKFDVYRQEALLGGYLFFHGEELPASNSGKMLVMGHLHPSIAVFSKIGVKEKLPCFLSGKFPDGRKLIVMPAMNYFAEGVEVNYDNVLEIAPVFGKLNIDAMRAYCIGEGETLDFGIIRELKRIG